MANGHPQDALEFLNKAADTNAEIENQGLKAYMQLQPYEEAEKMGADPRIETSLQTMNLKVQLAAVQQLPIAEYLRRMDRLLESQAKMMAANM